MKITDQVDIPKKFLYLTDDLMPRIESSEEPSSKAPERFSIECAPATSTDLLTSVSSSWSAILISDLTELTPDSVIVDHTTLHYGMKDKNPLDFVKFYSKRNPDTCAHAQKGDYSMLMPPIFAEVYLTIFSKHPPTFFLYRFIGLVQGGYRAVLKSIPDSFSSTTTEPPSTPKRGHSRTGSLTSISENSFTTVPLNYTAPSTPSRNLKRSRDGGSLGSIEGDERQPKRQA
ncbi:hypothetical protein MVEN_02641100 [Mycena venus]|uniref:Uncharacterized protein n=1 Tax=Mycena venus TaxID=2733690 RepID=A0A8H6TSG5_9AGAR|nr:hypothetical protein MVEN_02641100 [Mycena venus]